MTRLNLIICLLFYLGEKLLPIISVKILQDLSGSFSFHFVPSNYIHFLKFIPDGIKSNQ